MFGVLSVVSIGVGSALAYVTKSYPSRVETLETCAGAFLIVGLGLLGAALPHLA
ncbi:hypothetical protein WDM22_04745 [Bradyrhizobium septentrionale]|uniref:Uncharacterized protein n=1 Tax=Bradyrhizobium septentrionale TaxID=1404411 RepID=A0A973VUF9_9BRAD|nr:hypothetical protein [Bradyrhizobium septentrionale]UGY19518.1 hypothetical protein HAP48_0019915 [Bradyrhizobium septentrionale]UGY28287.1 hypothetical protein HU675_0016830 [Bradyrhizobium septentrionale]